MLMRYSSFNGFHVLMSTMNDDLHKSLLSSYVVVQYCIFAVMCG